MIKINFNNQDFQIELQPIIGWVVLKNGEKFFAHIFTSERKAVDAILSYYEENKGGK